jgi:hypothetical protein
LLDGVEIQVQGAGSGEVEGVDAAGGAPSIEGVEVGVDPVEDDACRVGSTPVYSWTRSFIMSLNTKTSSRSRDTT